MSAPQYGNYNVTLDDVQAVLSTHGKEDQASEVFESLTSEDFATLTQNCEGDFEVMADVAREALDSLLREKGII